LKKLLKEADIDGNGTLEFEEFAGLMSSLMSEGGSGGSSKWEKVFKKFDKDGSGSIDESELKAAIESFGLKINQKDL
jgi:Ca2+-binding EF-hand superfamily protein